MAADPAFEARAVDGVDDGDAVEVDVGDVGEEALVLAETADAEAVRGVANCAIMDGHVVGAGLDGEGVVAVVDCEVFDFDVLSVDAEAVGVEGEGTGVADGVDYGVGYEDVLADELHVPAWWLQDFVVLDVAVGGVEGKHMGTGLSSGAVGWVGVPPGLSIPVNPAAEDGRVANIVDVRTREFEPVQRRAVGAGGGVIDDLLRILDVGGQMKVAGNVNGDIVEVRCTDGLQDVIIDAFAEDDVGIARAVLECRKDGRGVICFSTRRLVFRRDNTSLGSLRSTSFQRRTRCQ